MKREERIRARSLELQEYAVKMRRAIHEIAELSNEEERTSALIEQELKSFGLVPERVAPYTLVAVLDTGRPGKAVAMRADIDALAVPENPNNLAGPRCCVSQTPGHCHACGHDAHAAMLLASAKLLCELKDELCGRFCFCFEQGEETGRGIGAGAIRQKLREWGADTVWAIHVYKGLQSGKLCVEAGPRMAGAAGVEVTVHGKGGHGSRPDLSISPVYCASAIVTNLAGAFVNQLDANETVTMGITSIEGGGGSANIFPDDATISGSFRFFRVSEGEKAVKILKSVAEHTAAMNGCTVEFSQKTRVLVGPCINDEACSALAQRELPKVLGPDVLSGCEKWYASESFSHYLEEIPGILCHLGIQNPAYGSGAEHHNEYFDVDENVLHLGVAATVQYAAAFAARND